MRRLVRGSNRTKHQRAVRTSAGPLPPDRVRSARTGGRLHAWPATPGGGAHVRRRSLPAHAELRADAARERRRRDVLHDRRAGDVALSARRCTKSCATATRWAITPTHIPTSSPAGDVRGQLQSTIRAIRALSGYTPCVFRPPYGDYDGSIVRTAASLGLATITWEVDPSDYALPGTAAIRAARAGPGPARLDRDLPRRRRPSRTDIGGISRHHPRAALARLSLRNGPRAAGLSWRVPAVRARLRRRGDSRTPAARLDRRAGLSAHRRVRRCR